MLKILFITFLLMPVQESDNPIYSYPGGVFYVALDEFKAGNYKQAIELGTQAVQVYREEGNKAMLAKSLYITGYSREELADYGGAVIDYRELLEEEAEDPKVNLYAYKNTAVIYKKFREYNEALHYNEKALEIAGKHLPEEKAAILYNMGNVCKENDAIAKAIVYYQSARELALEAADYQLAAKANLDLGISFKAQGNYEEARASYQEIIADQENLQEHYSRYAGMAYQNIGVTYMDEGKLDEAIKSFRKALELKKGGDPESLFISYLDLGDCYFRKGDTLQAISAWKNGVDYMPNETLRADYLVINKYLAEAYKPETPQFSEYLTKYAESLESLNNQKVEEAKTLSLMNEDGQKRELSREKKKASDKDTYQNTIILWLILLVCALPPCAVEAYRWWIGRSLSKKIRAILDKNPNV